YILPIILFLLSLHVLHEMKSGVAHDEEVKSLYNKISGIERRIHAGEVTLIPPNDLVSHTREMALKNRGDIWWFNICIGMFLSDSVFENVFRPAIENPNTKKIVPILREPFKEMWQEEVSAKIKRCKGSEKVEEPIWRDIKENIAFTAIDLGEGDLKEADISVWGEPFMAEYPIGETNVTKSVPRYLLHVKSDSELIYRLKDIFKKYSLK
ncbi:MAG: hypothetical protein V3W37_03490, partial [Candidatus Binatia bacterium]